MFLAWSFCLQMIYVEIGQRMSWSFHRLSSFGSPIPVSSQQLSSVLSPLRVSPVHCGTPFHQTASTYTPLQRGCPTPQTSTWLTASLQIQTFHQDQELAGMSHRTQTTRQSWSHLLYWTHVKRERSVVKLRRKRVPGLVKRRIQPAPWCVHPHRSSQNLQLIWSYGRFPTWAGLVRLLAAGTWTKHLSPFLIPGIK